MKNFLSIWIREISVCFFIAGVLAHCPTLSAAEPAKGSHEERLAELERLVKLQSDALAALQSKLKILETQPRILRAGREIVPVNNQNYGRLTVRLPDGLGFDPAKDRIVLTSELSKPGGHNYLPLLDEIKKAGFTIHVADVQSHTFTEEVPVHWIIVRQP